jgi:hypothetical protein
MVSDCRRQAPTTLCTTLVPTPTVRPIFRMPITALVGWQTGHSERIFPGMTNPADKITLEPRPLKVGPEWHVVATYPMGGKEHIIGFRSEAEALAWMKSDRCAAWVKARGY